MTLNLNKTRTDPSLGGIDEVPGYYFRGRVFPIAEPFWPDGFGKFVVGSSTQTPSRWDQMPSESDGDFGEFNIFKE